MDNFRLPSSRPVTRRTQTIDGFGSQNSHRRPVQPVASPQHSRPMFGGPVSPPKPAEPVHKAAPICLPPEHAAAPKVAPVHHTAQQPAHPASRPMFRAAQEDKPFVIPAGPELKPAKVSEPSIATPSRLAPPAKAPVSLPTQVVEAVTTPDPIPLEPVPVYVEEPAGEPISSDSQPVQADPGLDLSLADTPAADRPKNRLHTGKAFRKWMLRGGVAFACLLLSVGGLLFYQGLNKVHKVFKGTANRPAALQAEVNPTLLKGEGDGRVNILLLGNGGTGHDGPDLTDTIMVASIDPVNKSAVLLSVPRDLWVNMPNNFMGANQKINAAYEAGKYSYLGKQDASNANSKAVEAGFGAADKVVSEVLGITIHYNAVVNFQAFRQAVDTVGGVDINVPQALVDPTMAWENNHNPTLAAAGLQHMDGVKALLYARSRETSSDFARGERQRSIILALKQKALTLDTLSNPVKISQLMSAFGDNMVTDLSLSDAVRLYDITKGINNDNITSLDLVTAPNKLVTTGTMNGNTSIDQPVEGLYKYDNIQAFVRSSLKDGYLSKENAQIMVLNGTKMSGLATVKANELKSYGYNVVKVDNAPTDTYTKTVVVDMTNGADKYTKHYLENRYKVSSTPNIPDANIQQGNANFIVILGSDQQ